MDTQLTKGKEITEEQFRSCYPDVSIQHLSEKASPKVNSPSVEKRSIVKTPVKAAAMPRSPAVAKTPLKAPIVKLQNISVKTNISSPKANLSQAPQKTLMVSPNPAVPKTPVGTKPSVVSKTVTPKTSVASRTPVLNTSAQVLKSPGPVKAVNIKNATPAVKNTPVKTANVKTPQQVVKQQANVAKIPSKPTSTASASKEDSPDQSTMTVFTYHMPQSTQRSKQLTIEKIDQQQRIPVVLDSNNQAVLQQVINNGQVVLQNRVPAECTLQSAVVIGSTAQAATTGVPHVEITTSEPLQALQVTQQVTLFRPKGDTFTVDDVKKQLNKQSAMTNVVSSTTNSISAPVQSQAQKKVVAATREQTPAASPVRQSNRVTSQVRQQQPQQQQQKQQLTQKTAVNAQNYQSTRGQVKKVSPKREIPIQKVPPKREIPTQKVSPMLPPPIPPPEMLLGNEEEVTTSEDRPAESLPGSTKLIVILPSGKKKEITINESFPTNATLQDLLKTINMPMPENATNMTAEVFTDRDGELEHDEVFQEDIDTNEVQWEHSENNGVEIGEIVHMNDEIEPGELHEETVITKEDESQNELNTESYKEGLLAVCSFCGYTSTNFSRCQRCSRPIPPDCKTISDNFLQKSRKTKADSLSNDSPKKKRVCRKKRSEEPVCLTISDDEELLGLAALQQSNRSHSQLNEESFHSDSNSQLSSCDKEPVITEEMVAEMKRSTSGVVGSQDSEDSLDESSAKQTLLQCRTVRIGSYKVVPKDKVVITPRGLKVTVPVLNSDQYVELKIMLAEIIKVLIHFGRGMPVLFFYTRPSAAAKIRKALKMEDPSGFYYDTTSSDETHRRITLLPDKLDEDCKQTLKNIFYNQEHNVFAELTGKEANDILVKASPKEVQAFILKKQPNNQPQPPPVFNGQNIQTIMVYPPPPEKGGIPINTEDYACLGEDQFLNDVIIDFYLKYVVEKTLSPVDRARTHVFSSFFYKRLTTKPPPKRKCMNAVESDPTTSPAAKRHSRVKSWTKNVDLFTKDFIVIPINESSHWFLAIICFPGLTGPVRFSDNTPIEFPGRKKNKIDASMSGKHTVTIGSTTITAVSQNNMNTMEVVTDDGEDRDEADGENENMDVPDEEEEISKAGLPEVKEEPEEEDQPMKTRSSQREPIKQPCILVFDSLAGASRARVVATLRDYLRIEYEVKHGHSRDFSGDVMKGTNVRCPQQTNYTDCGLYVLQYVEAFFQMPVLDYRIPIKQLQTWFQADIVSRKRYEIQQLLHRLMQEQNLDLETLNLPHLNLRPEGKRMVEYSGTEEEDEEEEEDPMCEEEEEDEMIDEDDFDMDHENDEMEEGEIGHHDEDPDSFIDPNMEHEEHELEEEVVDYGMEDEEDDEPQEDEMEKELDDVSVLACGPVKRKDLRNIRIPRLTSKNMTEDA